MREPLRRLIDWMASYTLSPPGDVMAIKYFDDASSNSGHTMILESATPTLTYADGSVRWSVKVIDCELDGIPVRSHCT